MSDGNERLAVLETLVKIQSHEIRIVRRWIISLTIVVSAAVGQDLGIFTAMFP